MPATSLTDGVVALRPPDEADIDAITLACQDAEIEAWVSTPWPYERSHAEWFLESRVRPGWESGKDQVWSVREVGTDRLLGMIGLHSIADGSAEIGYWIAPWGRGAGVASRAMALVVDHAFDPDGVGLVRLLWMAYVGNWPSRRVAWRAGFRVEGTLRQHAIQRAGIRRDAWVGTILRGHPREPDREGQVQREPSATAVIAPECIPIPHARKNRPTVRSRPRPGIRRGLRGDCRGGRTSAYHSARRREPGPSASPT